MFDIPPRALALGLPDAATRLTPMTPGLLPVERHILDTLRAEFVELCVEAFKASLLADQKCHTLHAPQPVDGRSWKERAAHYLDASGAMHVEPVHESELFAGLAEGIWPRHDRRRLLLAALRLADSARLRIYLCCEHQARGDWRTSVQLAEDVTVRRTAPSVQKHAFDTLGVGWIGLGREEAAEPCYERALVTAQRQSLTDFEVAIPALNLCTLAVRLGREDQLLRASQLLDSLDSISAASATARHVDILRRATDHGWRTDARSVDSARRHFDRLGTSSRRVIDALA
ncbi:MAG: hypothetical protein K8S98_05540 [Planctomycetes bacterium]|nr:hypothetical protein [Planctomycetota bacterium]